MNPDQFRLIITKITEIIYSKLTNIFNEIVHFNSIQDVDVICLL